MIVSSTPAITDSASVRNYLIGALRLDLIGPRPEDHALQYERLPYAPSHWYLTGFLAPAQAPHAQRVQDAGEELDEPGEPSQGSDDAGAPERGSGKRLFLPSSIGLSVLVDASTKHLEVTLAWGDYAPEPESPQDVESQSDRLGTGDEATTPRAQDRPALWTRRPRVEKVSIDLDATSEGATPECEVPGSDGLKIVWMTRTTQVRVAGRNTNTQAVSLFGTCQRP